MPSIGHSNKDELLLILRNFVSELRFLNQRVQSGRSKDLRVSSVIALIDLSVESSHPLFLIKLWILSLYSDLNKTSQINIIPPHS